MASFMISLLQSTTLISVMLLVLCKATSVLPHASSSVSKQAADTVIVAIGGETEVGRYSRGVDIFSLASNTHFNTSSPAPAEVAYFGSCVSNNTIYIVGGLDSHHSVNYFWSYDIRANTWTNLPSFPHRVDGSGLVALDDGTIISLGGYREHTYMDMSYVFDRQNQTWQPLAYLPSTSLTPCVVTTDGTTIFYISYADTYRSDNGAKTWVKLSSMNVGRLQAACVAVGDGILVAGGIDEDLVEIYNITANTWTTVAPLSKKRTGAAAVLLPPRNDGNASVLVCGGYKFFTNEAYSDCEEYDLSTDQWKSSKFDLSFKRFFHGLFVGQV